MHYPKFDLKQYKPFDKSISYTLSGNNNLVIRNIFDAKGGTIHYVRYSYDKVCRFVEYLVDSGVGTNRGIGKIGDITKTGTSKLSYVMVTKSKDNPIPTDDEIYYNRKLIKPDQFVLYTLGSNIKIDATVITNESDGSLELCMKLHNIPTDGVTLPTTITDGFTNWLSYWFATEATARRLRETRNKVTKFKGHHSMSDIYLANDMKSKDKLLVAIFNDKHPSRCLVFSNQSTKDGGKCIMLFNHNIITNDTILVKSFHNPVSIEEIMDFINSNVDGINIKAKGDVETFFTYYHKWLKTFKYNPF